MKRLATSCKVLQQNIAKIREIEKYFKSEDIEDRNNGIWSNYTKISELENHHRRGLDCSAGIHVLTKR